MDRTKMATDLERVTEAQLSSALTLPAANLQRSLSSADLSILLAEMDTLIRRYPSQDQEQSIEVFQRDLEALALKYSLRKVQKALAALRIKPGQTFFPKPDEVADEIEHQRERSKYAEMNREGEEFLKRQREAIAAFNSPEEVAWRKERGLA